RCAFVGMLKGQMSEEAAAAILLHDRLRAPVARLQPIANMRVHRRARPGPVMIVARAQVVVAKLYDRDEPVPVEQSDIVVKVGGGVPAQKVVVKYAELARCVVVTDVVIIGLRERHVDQAEDEKAQPQASRASPFTTWPKCHDFAPLFLSNAGWV